MMAFGTLARSVAAGAFCLVAWVGAAHAVLLSDIYDYQTHVTSVAPTLTVGDILFTFTSCGGTDCTNLSVVSPFSTPFNQNFEVVGVLPSPSTGPGGGIVVQSIGTAPLLAIGSTQGNDVSLHWSATSANPIVGAQGSAVGSGVNAGGGGSTTLGGLGGSLGSVNMNPNLSSPNIIAFAAQPLVLGATDYNITSGSLTSSTVFLSQVPEPISVSLLLSGLVGLGCARRRRSR